MNECAVPTHGEIRPLRSDIPPGSAKGDGKALRTGTGARRVLLRGAHSSTNLGFHFSGCGAWMGAGGSTTNGGTWMEHREGGTHVFWASLDPRSR
jgi:hypothetical protein